MKLENEELQNIYGGGAGGLFILGIIGLGTLLAGIIDGFTRPLPCND